MPRRTRQCPAGFVYHVWNRAAGRLRLFKKPEDYLAFGRVLLEAHRRHPIDLLDWCLMPNHWHFVVQPKRDDDVTKFFRWLTHTHAMRSITHRNVIGLGPLYRGAFKSLPVERDEHLAALLRYVERNPLRAGLVKRALAVAMERSLDASQRAGGTGGDCERLADRSPGELGEVGQRAANRSDMEALRECVRRGRRWRAATLGVAKAHDLLWTLRPRGRPALAKLGKELRPL